MAVASDGDWNISCGANGAPPRGIAPRCDYRRCAGGCHDTATVHGSHSIPWRAVDGVAI